MDRYDKGSPIVIPMRGELAVDIIAKAMTQKELRGEDDAISGGVATLEQIPAGCSVANRKHDDIVVRTQQHDRFDPSEVAIADDCRHVEPATTNAYADGVGAHVCVFVDRRCTSSSTRAATFPAAAETASDSPTPKPIAPASIRNTVTSVGNASRKICRPA